MAQWLAEDAEHVVVVHCKAGKGRTGLMICGMAYEPPPHIGFGHHSAHLQFQVLQPLVPPFLSEVYTVNLNKKMIILELSTPLLLSGDMKIAFSQKLNVDLLHLSAKPKFLSHIPHGKLFHFWFNTFFVDLQHSTPLSHDLAKASGTEGLKVRFPSLKKLPTASTPSSPVCRKPFPRSSYSRRAIFTPTPIKNRFAALSLPNLPAQFVGDSPYTVMEHPPSSQCLYMCKIAAETVKEKFELPPGCEMLVRLRKDQIDKASKDTSGRFAAKFSVTLVVIKPDARDNGCKVSPESCWHLSG